MPRCRRPDSANICHHVLNRANGRAAVFETAGDYAAFLEVMVEASARIPLRLLAYCLMPNHFHLVVWPRQEGELGRWMAWLMTTHGRRYHAHHGTSGCLWQGRYRAFAIQDDDHLLTVMRYVERNPVRAEGLGIRNAATWPWSSASACPCSGRVVARPEIHPAPVYRRPDWLAWVNEPLTPSEHAAIRRSIERNSPFGDSAWTSSTAQRLGLAHTLAPLGRRKKGTVPDSA